MDPRTTGNSSPSNRTYQQASLELYEALTGDYQCTGASAAIGSKNYLDDLRPDIFGRANMSAPVSAANRVQYLSDPFGNCYGYSTANSTAVTSGSSFVPGYHPPETSPGYNPTFDMWSTGGTTDVPATGTSANQPGDPAQQWIRNW